MRLFWGMVGAEQSYGDVRVYGTTGHPQDHRGTTAGQPAGQPTGQPAGQPLGQPWDNPRDGHGAIHGTTRARFPPPSPFEGAELVELVIELV